LIDGLKKIEAEHSEFVKGDYKNLYEKGIEQIETMRKTVAFGNAKPKFDGSVNEYEASAKWDSFVKSTLDGFNIVLDEQNVAFAVDKENEYKSVKLTDLVKENQEIQELVKGRQQTGLGTNQKQSVDIEGVPFKVPENATPKERQQAITDYITTDLKIAKHDGKYAKLFGDFNSKILGQTSA